MKAEVHFVDVGGGRVLVESEDVRFHTTEAKADELAKDYEKQGYKVLRSSTWRLAQKGVWDR